ncbi:MAG: nucleotidyltransferase domain-containing protein [Candidatus Kapaibacteriota bacterium]|jgi:predicted nucleotidyltransferase
MKFGLKDETILKIQSAFIKFPGIEKVVIYGSRAKGNYRNGSDIDITLFGKELSHQILLRLMNEIDELNTPYMFDISIYDTLSSETLKEHIDRVGLVFYERD